MTPFTDKDLARLALALERRERVVLERRVGDTLVTARTLPAGPAWGVPMVVQVRTERSGLVILQTFDAVEGEDA